MEIWLMILGALAVIFLIGLLVERKTGAGLTLPGQAKLARMGCAVPEISEVDPMGTVEAVGWTQVVEVMAVVGVMGAGKKANGHDHAIGNLPPSHPISPP